MVRLAVIVEGFTEKEFVNQILAPYLYRRSVYAYAPNLQGNVSQSAVLAEMRRLANKYDFVTTMVDCYGFKGRKQRTADEIESEIANSCSEHSRKMIPYLQRYEFEALLFADESAIARCLNLNSSQRKKLNDSGLPPEEINHQLPPSARIKRVCSGYQKILKGVEIAETIGLPAIMAKCPKFAEWVRELEKLGEK